MCLFIVVWLLLCIRNIIVVIVIVVVVVVAVVVVIVVVIVIVVVVIVVIVIVAVVVVVIMHARMHITTSCQVHPAEQAQPGHHHVPLKAVARLLFWLCKRCVWFLYKQWQQSK